MQIVTGDFPSEERARMRLADEYDVAQERGEVAKLGSNQTEVGVGDHNTLPTAADIGLRRDEIHEARTYLRESRR